VVNIHNNEYEYLGSDVIFTMARQRELRVKETEMRNVGNTEQGIGEERTA